MNDSGVKVSVASIFAVQASLAASDLPMSCVIRWHRYFIRRYSRQWCCMLLLAGSCVVYPKAIDGQDDLATASNVSHSDLTVYQTADGTVKPIQSLDDWRKRRSQIIAGAEAAMGALPAMDTPLEFDVQVSEDVQIGDVRRLTMTIAVEGSDRLPLDLYLPKGIADQVDVKNIFDGDSTTRFAAIVALHPTGAAGKRIVAGEGGLAGRQYGLELAQRGYVVIAPDYPSFGAYADYDFAGDNYVSGTMKGIVNHRRCIDLLSQLNFVDADRIGAIGHSLGGHNAIFLGVFDPRVKVVVSSCGWCPFHDYYGGDIRGWTSERYMPRLRDNFHLDPDKVPFDFHELIAALAPRTFVSASPLHDANFDILGVRKAIPAASFVYSLWGVPDELILFTPDCEHDFPTEIRLKTYDVIDRVLQPIAAVK